MNSPVNFNFVAFSESRAKLHQQFCFADYIFPLDPLAIISLKEEDSPKPARRPRILPGIWRDSFIVIFNRLEY